MFQGEWIPNTGRALLRLLIDGVVQTGPGDAASPFAAHEGTEDSTNGFNFITNPQRNAATHTAKIQWASVFGDSICVDERSMVYTDSHKLLKNCASAQIQASVSKAATG